MNDSMTRIGAHTLAAPTLETLRPYVTATGAGPLAAWLEDEGRADGLQLRDDLSGPGEAAALVMAWPQGHIFGPTGHLQWERQPDGGTHLVLICDGASPWGGEWLELAPVGEEAIILWGERRGEWSEGRIPDVGRLYPQTWAGPRAALEVRYYEADWPEAASVRLVTRYLAFQGTYDLQEDDRFSATRRDDVIDTEEVEG